MPDPRLTSQRDQAAAVLRDARRELLKLAAGFRKRDWFADMDNLQTLLGYMVDQCDDLEEVRRVIKEVIAKPWHWRPEFVIAKCLELDKGRNHA